MDAAASANSTSASEYGGLGFISPEKLIKEERGCSKIEIPEMNANKKLWKTAQSAVFHSFLKANFLRIGLKTAFCYSPFLNAHVR